MHSFGYLIHYCYFPNEPCYFPLCFIHFLFYFQPIRTLVLSDSWLVQHFPGLILLLFFKVILIQGFLHSITFYSRSISSLRQSFFFQSDRGIHFCPLCRSSSQLIDRNRCIVSLLSYKRGISCLKWRIKISFRKIGHNCDTYCSRIDRMRGSLHKIKMYC